MDCELILKIVNLLDKPRTTYQIHKIIQNKGKTTIYRYIKKMEELHIIIKEGNLIYPSGGNVFKLSNGTFLAYFGDRIPVILNCPYWNNCPLKEKYIICFGESECKLLKKILS